MNLKTLGVDTTNKSELGIMIELMLILINEVRSLRGPKEEPQDPVCEPKKRAKAVKGLE